MSDSVEILNFDDNVNYSEDDLKFIEMYSNKILSNMTPAKLIFDAKRNVDIATFMAQMELGYLKTPKHNASIQDFKGFRSALERLVNERFSNKD